MYLVKIECSHASSQLDCFLPLTGLVLHMVVDIRPLDFGDWHYTSYLK